MLLIILQSNIMSLSNLRKFIQCYIRQSLIINNSTNFLFLSNLVRNWFSTTNKTHRIINTKSSSQILLIFEKFYTTHRVNIFLGIFVEHSHDIFPEYSEKVRYETPGNIHEIMFQEY